MNQRTLGIIQVILSGACFGALGFFGKKAYSLNITSGELLALRYSVSALFTLMIILMTAPKTLKLKAFDFFSSLMLGIFGYALFSSLFFWALTGLSASLTVLLLYTYPGMVALLSHWLLKEKLNKYGYGALAICSIGMFLLVYGEWSVNSPFYILLGVLSAFFYSLYIIFSRKYLSHLPALPSSFLVQLGAGLVLSLIHFKSTERVEFIFQHHSLLIFSMAFICSFLAMTLFLAGLSRLSSSETSILSTTEPLFGVIIATLFLGESLSSLQIVGGVLILAGMILITKYQKA